MYTVASPDPDPNHGGRGHPDECNSTLTSATREETLTPDPNECSSTLTSGSSGGVHERMELVGRSPHLIPLPCAKIEKTTYYLLFKVF